MVVVKFVVFVSEVVSIFSKILTWIIGGQKDTFAQPTQLLGGTCPGCPPKSTPMVTAALSNDYYNLKICRPISSRSLSENSINQVQLSLINKLINGTGN